METQTLATGKQLFQIHVLYLDAPVPARKSPDGTAS
jgi:hypothetical protein